MQFHRHHEIHKVCIDYLKRTNRCLPRLVPGTSSGRPIGTATRLTTASGVSVCTYEDDFMFFVDLIATSG